MQNKLNKWFNDLSKFVEGLSRTSSATNSQNYNNRATNSSNLHSNNTSFPLRRQTSNVNSNQNQSCQTQNRNNMNRGASNSIPNQNADKVDKINIGDIKDPSDISDLTTKQLKIILTRNCIEFRGVFEKEVLREKVLQLWVDDNGTGMQRKRTSTVMSDSKRSPEGLSSDIDESQLCKICMENEINCVLLDCGHYLTCVTCGRKLADCPICRQNVVRVVRTFRA